MRRAKLFGPMPVMHEMPAPALESGGEGGIRTLGTVARTPHFECGAFDHSATSPEDAWSCELRRLRVGAGGCKGGDQSAFSEPRGRVIRQADEGDRAPTRLTDSEASLLRRFLICEQLTAHLRAAPRNPVVNPVRISTPPHASLSVRITGAAVAFFCPGGQCKGPDRHERSEKAGFLCR